jgi:hypothetical protein
MEQLRGAQVQASHAAEEHKYETRMMKREMHQLLRNLRAIAKSRKPTLKKVLQGINSLVEDLELQIDFPPVPQQIVDATRGHRQYMEESYGRKVDAKGQREDGTAWDQRRLTSKPRGSRRRKDPGVKARRGGRKGKTYR